MHYRNNCKCEEKTKDQEIQHLVETLREKNDFLAELKRERHSLEQKLKDLGEDLKKQVHKCDTAFSLLEAEKNTTTKLTEENRALVVELCVLQQAANDMTSRHTAMETELSIKTTEVTKLSEELQKAQALLQKYEEAATGQSQMIKSLKLEIENLRQQLSAKELSEEQINQCVFKETIATLRRECETMMSTSLEKSKRITALTEEITHVREEMHQKQTRCTQLEEERGSRRDENQNLLSRYEAKKLVVEQMKRRHSEMETTLHGVREQLAILEEKQQTFTLNSERVGELEKKLDEKETYCADLEQRLLQTQNKLDQAEERQRCVESSLKDSKKEAADSLVHNNAELEMKAQELLQ